MAQTREQRLRAKKVYDLNVSRGVAHTYPAAEALELAERQLRENGWSIDQLQAAAGLSPNAVWLLRHRRKRVMASTMEALRVLPYRDRLKPAPVPSRATTLRLRALACEGYDMWTLARELGLTRPVRYDRWTTVNRDIAESVLALVKRLSGIPGPTPRAGVIARSRGWLPVSAYDQELFWDVEWDGMDGVLREPTPAERVAELEHLIRTGVTMSEAISRTGAVECRPRQVLNALLCEGKWVEIEKIRLAMEPAGFNWFTVITAATRSPEIERRPSRSDVPQWRLKIEEQA